MSFRWRRGRASFSVSSRGPRAGYRLGCVLPIVVAIVVAALSVAACSSSSPEAQTTQRPPNPTATPLVTPTPWTLDVPSAKYTTEVFVGDTISIDVKIKNTGTAKSPVTRLNFSELDKYADLHRCKPKCETEDLPGLGPSAVMVGVPPKKSTTFHIEFLATTVGVVDWSVCLYDDEEYGDPVWCGDGKTAIR